MAHAHTDLDEQSFSQQIAISAPIERVFQQLTTLEGIASWWSDAASGDPGEHGEISFGVHDSDDYTRVRVETLLFPTDIAWSVVEDSGYQGEWINTHIVFHLEEEIDASTQLSLHHHGLTPLLDCYVDCRSGWERHLQRIKQSAEAQAGT